MDFNLPQNLRYCGEFVADVSNILYYSHIPSAFAALIIGGYILYKSNYALLSKILFLISLVFSLWVLSNLTLWMFYSHNSLIMAIWAFIEVLALLLFILCLYFIYVFIYQKDVSFLVKILLLCPLLLVTAISTTSYNLSEFDIQECIAIENSFYMNLVSYLKGAYALLICSVSIFAFFQTNRRSKKQIAVLSTGVMLFLLSFLIAGKVADETGQYIYEALGLLGMVLFIACLGYLIVKFNIFNIKLIATQALVLTMIFLTWSNVFYTNSKIEFILSVSTFVFICIGGYFLTKSVKREIEQREKIQNLANNLVKANQELKENDKQKDELLSIVSHQLATPASSVKWYLEMMLDGDLGKITKNQKEHLISLMRITQGLTDLVSMILDVSRIQLGRMKIEKQEIDLSIFFKEIFEIINPQAIEKKVKLKIDIPSKLPLAMLDRRYTHMTIENLLANAIKYSRSEGSVKFIVKIENQKMYCEVSDNGVGIPKKDQSKIFGKMFRASNVNNISGNGFGLYVAKGAIEAQGGRIWFKSQQGKGTTFFLELPI